MSAADSGGNITFYGRGPIIPSPHRDRLGLESAGCTTPRRGASRSRRMDGQFVVSTESFVQEAMLQLEDGRDEVLVGPSIGARKQGEALFARPHEPLAANQGFAAARA
jgi:hypothetical protein